MINKYKAIISDVDGTLSPLAPYPKPSRLVVKTVRKLANEDVMFSLATGKPFFMIEHLLNKLSLSSPIIVDDGAAIFDPKTRKPIWVSWMDEEKVRKIFEIGKKFNKRMRLSEGLESIDIDKSLPNGVKAIKFFIVDLTIVEAEEFIKEVEVELKDVAIARAQSYKGVNFADVYVKNADATKQFAILKFAEITGIKTSDIMGIGDHYNDFPLLMACGLKVAMGNAVSDLKAIADYIAPSVEEDGLAVAIEKFIFNK